MSTPPSEPFMETLAHRSVERRHRQMANRVRGPLILDIGFAEAPNRHLHAKGYVVGYDMAEVTAVPGYDEVIQGDVADIARTLRGRRFDTIVLGELIEHVESPYHFLRDVACLMHEDSRLILSTPNPLSIPVIAFEFLRSRRFFYTKHHLYYFLPRWLERMLDVSGYRVEEIMPTGLYHLPVPVPRSLSYILIYIAAKKSVMANL